MKKRINLYNPATQKRSFNVKSLSGGVTVVGIIVGVFLLLGVVLFGYASSQQAALAELKKSKKSLDGSVASEQARFTGVSAHSEIVAEQKKINAELLALQDLKMLLQYVQPDRQVVFSKYIYALSESSLSSSWLTGFNINSAENSFVFSGGADTAEDVPVMLESIVRTVPFQRMTVADLSITAEENNVVFQTKAELGSNE